MRLASTLTATATLAFLVLAQAPAVRAAEPAAARAPEAIGLDGREFFPPELQAETKQRMEAALAAAVADFEKNPGNVDNIVWVGRRLSYLSRYQEALDVYSRGIAKFPDEPRLLRHRGHRYITTRQFGKAIVDLERAARLMEGKPDEGEPDGAPGLRPSPSSTFKFNIYYHLGLAHYLRGEFEQALVAYRECMKYSTDNDDSLVATSDWLYMTLRRLGRKAEASQVLEPIREGMDVLDNAAYYHRLLMYKGLRKPEEVLGTGGGEQDPLEIATQGYGVGNFYLVNGDVERAQEIFRKVVEGTQWAAFGFIAAEAELERTGPKDVPSAPKASPVHIPVREAGVIDTLIVPDTTRPYPGVLRLGGGEGAIASCAT